MKKITFWFEVIAAIIAVAILQACTSTSIGTTTGGKCQCETPSLDPSSVTDHVGKIVMVTLKTNTPGAKVRWRLTGIVPNNGSTQGQTGTVPVKIEVFGRTMTATAYKPGCADSPPAEGHYRHP